jgi:single-strand DNA-binding protein
MYQSITIVGSLGADPDVRENVVNFPVAVDDSYTKQDGTRVKMTTWFSVAVWGKQGEACGKYLAKGRQVLVEGQMVTSKPYQAKDGEWRTSLNLKARNVRFLGSKSDNEASNANGKHTSGGGSDDEDFMGDSPVGGGNVPW